MAYIKERGENTYLVRITIGTDGHGKPIQKSHTFHPSKAKLPKTKLRKELSAFVEAFESEYRNADNSHYESPSPQPDSAFVPEVLPPALVQPMPGIIQSNDKAVNIVEYLRNITKKQPTITELKSVLIKDSFTDQFDDAKLTLKFGQVRRKISLSEFSGLIAEYDITSELEYAADGSVKKESLYALADQYALTFLEDKE